jgi:hypothetical protein
MAVRNLLPLLLFGAHASLYPQGATAQQKPHPLGGVDAASVICVKPVTDELVVRPARRPDDQPYLCYASVRLPSEETLMHSDQVQVVLFAGEQEGTLLELRGGMRAELTCSIDSSGQRADVRLLLTSQAKPLLSSRAIVWLAGPRP